MNKLSKDKLEQKKQDLEYINQFRMISVSNVCSDLKINYANVYYGTASARNIHKIRKELEKRLKCLENRF